MKRAIATLAVGKYFNNTFKQAFQPGWESYCRRHGIDLVVINESLDQTVRGKSRSPAWQKCILHKHSSLTGYDQIAWVDADIFIRDTAPNVFDSVPIDKFGAVDDHATPSKEEHSLVTQRAYMLWEREGIPFHKSSGAAEWYQARSIQCDFQQVVQSGMFVFSPSIHGSLLEHVYESYESLGQDNLNHEMAALSYEMIRSGKMEWLSPKFNMMWICYELLNFPFLQQPNMIPGKLPLFVKKKIVEYLRQPCVRISAENNYFLHFSGGSKYYRYLV